MSTGVVDQDARNPVYQIDIGSQTLAVGDLVVRARLDTLFAATFVSCRAQGMTFARINKLVNYTCNQLS